MSAAGKADGSLPVWIKAQLLSFLGYPDDGQLTNHLLNFSSRTQLLEYCAEMMGPEPKVAAFAAELWRRKGGDPASAASSAAAVAAGSAAGSGSKRRDDGDLFGSSAPSTSSAALKQKHSAPMPSASAGPAPSSSSSSSSSSYSSGQATAASLDLGRNIKVKVLASRQQGGAAERTRARCHCQAATHPLFSNCTACGKVVCEAEGEGPCFFCGSLVTQQGTFPSDQFQRHMRQLATLADGSPAAKAIAAAAKAKAKADGEEKKSDGGASASSSASSSAAAAAAAADASGLAAAEAQRNKLLGYAQSDAHKTRVYDDASDWFEFESNAWLSPEERAAKKAEADQAMMDLEKRRAHTLTIDLQGGRIVTHSSDAWERTLQSSQHDAQPKWTDEVPESAAGSATTGGSHGAFMAQAFAASPQLQRSVEEMKFVSTSQYYANDTLTGRAKEVYDMLKQSLRPQSNNPNDRPDTRLHGAHGQAANNPLLSSLAKAQRRGESKIAADDAGLEGVTDSMGELQLEQRLSANRCRGTAGVCAATADEDEPSCGAAPPANDSAFSDDSDRGVTLSLWQPWASLMVLGIKRFEGRGWFSSHRGRLWIASASREVDPAEVAQVEAQYRAVYGPHAKIPFPADYPTSALLGCVDMTACWSNEEFQSHRSRSGEAEDSESAFVFVCSNPRVLPVAQSISGAHKLWNLPPRLLEGIKATLKPVSERWRTSLLPAAAAAASGGASGGGFDLWPGSVRPASLSSASSLSAATRPSISALQPGMLLMRQFLSLAQQQAVVDCCRQLGLGAAGFAAPTRTDAAALHLKSFSLGLSWNAGAKKYEALNSAGRRVARVPDLLLDLVARCLKQATEYLSAHGARDQLPSYVPDLCVVNYYSGPAGRLAPHQDCDESPASIEKGYPVVSFSIGDSAAFVYGDKQADEAKQTGAKAKAKGAASAAGAGGAGAGAGGLSEVTLASGDVLLFGGPSRLVVHGVERILPQTKPRDLFLKQGRLNLTFRKL